MRFKIGTVLTLMLMFFESVLNDSRANIDRSGNVERSDSAVLTDVLEAIDTGNSDDPFINVTSILLNNLCACMRDTLNAKELNKLKKDHEEFNLYKKIYDRTCNNLQQTLSTLASHQACESNNTFTNYEFSDTGNYLETILEHGIKIKFKNLIYDILIKTKNQHKYAINKYNMYENPQRFDKKAMRSVIIIITLNSLQSDTEAVTKSTLINIYELDNILRSNGTVDIDFIDSTYESMNEKISKAKNVSYCNLKSVFTLLVQSENRNLLKTFKLLRKKGAIKIYTSLFTNYTHNEYSGICCNDKNVNELCRINDNLHDVNNIEETLYKQKQRTEGARHYKETVTKIKNLIQLYKKKLQLKNKKMDMTKVDNINNYDADYIRIPQITTTHLFYQRNTHLNTEHEVSPTFYENQNDAFHYSHFYETKQYKSLNINNNYATTFKSVKTFDDISYTVNEKEETNETYPKTDRFNTSQVIQHIGRKKEQLEELVTENPLTTAVYLYVTPTLSSYNKYVEKISKFSYISTDSTKTSSKSTTIINPNQIVAATTYDTGQLKRIRTFNMNDIFTKSTISDTYSKEKILNKNEIKTNAYNFNNRTKSGNDSSKLQSNSFYNKPIKEYTMVKGTTSTAEEINKNLMDYILFDHKNSSKHKVTSKQSKEKKEISNNSTIEASKNNLTTYKDRFDDGMLTDNLNIKYSIENKNKLILTTPTLTGPNWFTKSYVARNKQFFSDWFLKSNKTVIRPTPPLKVPKKFHLYSDYMTDSQSSNDMQTQKMTKLWNVQNIADTSIRVHLTNKPYLLKLYKFSPSTNLIKNKGAENSSLTLKICDFKRNLKSQGQLVQGLNIDHQSFTPFSNLSYKTTRFTDVNKINDSGITEIIRKHITRTKDPLEGVIPTASTLRDTSVTLQIQKESTLLQLNQWSTREFKDSLANNSSSQSQPVKFPGNTQRLERVKNRNNIYNYHKNHSSDDGNKRKIYETDMSPDVDHESIKYIDVTYKIHPSTVSNKINDINTTGTLISILPTINYPMEGVTSTRIFNNKFKKIKNYKKLQFTSTTPTISKSYETQKKIRLSDLFLRSNRNLIHNTSRTYVSEKLYFKSISSTMSSHTRNMHIDMATSDSVSGTTYPNIVYNSNSTSQLRNDQIKFRGYNTNSMEFQMTDETSNYKVTKGKTFKININPKNNDNQTTRSNHIDTMQPTKSDKEIKTFNHFVSKNTLETIKHKNNNFKGIMHDDLKNTSIKLHITFPSKMEETTALNSVNEDRTLLTMYDIKTTINNLIKFTIHPMYHKTAEATNKNIFHRNNISNDHRSIIDLKRTSGIITRFTVKNKIDESDTKGTLRNKLATIKNKLQGVTSTTHSSSQYSNNTKNEFALTKLSSKPDMFNKSYFSKKKLVTLSDLLPKLNNTFRLNKIGDMATLEVLEEYNLNFDPTKTDYQTTSNFKTDKNINSLNLQDITDSSITLQVPMKSTLVQSTNANKDNIAKYPRPTSRLINNKLQFPGTHIDKITKYKLTEEKLPTVMYTQNFEPIDTQNQIYHHLLDKIERHTKKPNAAKKTELPNYLKRNHFFVTEALYNNSTLTSFKYRVSDNGRSQTLKNVSITVPSLKNTKVNRLNEDSRFSDMHKIQTEQNTFVQTTTINNESKKLIIKKANTKTEPSKDRLNIMDRLMSSEILDSEVLVDGKKNANLTSLTKPNFNSNSCDSTTEHSKTTDKVKTDETNKLETNQDITRSRYMAPQVTLLQLNQFFTKINPIKHNIVNESSSRLNQIKQKLQNIEKIVTITNYITKKKVFEKTTQKPFNDKLNQVNFTLTENSLFEDNMEKFKFDKNVIAVQASKTNFKILSTAYPAAGQSAILSIKVPLIQGSSPIVISKSAKTTKPLLLLPTSKLLMSAVSLDSSNSHYPIKKTITTQDNRESLTSRFNVSENSIQKAGLKYLTLFDCNNDTRQITDTEIYITTEKPKIYSVIQSKTKKSTIEILNSSSISDIKNLIAKTKTMAVYLQPQDSGKSNETIENEQYSTRSTQKDTESFTYEVIPRDFSKIYSFTSSSRPSIEEGTALEYKDQILTTKNSNKATKLFMINKKHVQKLSVQNNSTITHKFSQELTSLNINKLPLKTIRNTSHDKTLMKYYTESREELLRSTRKPDVIIRKKIHEQVQQKNENLKMQKEVTKNVFKTTSYFLTKTDNNFKTSTSSMTKNLQHLSTPTITRNKYFSTKYENISKVDVENTTELTASISTLGGNTKYLSHYGNRTISKKSLSSATTKLSFDLSNDKRTRKWRLENETNNQIKTVTFDNKENKKLSYICYGQLIVTAGIIFLKSIEQCGNENVTKGVRNLSLPLLVLTNSMTTSASKNINQNIIGTLARPEFMGVYHTLVENAARIIKEEDQHFDKNVPSNKHYIIEKNMGRYDTTKLEIPMEKWDNHAVAQSFYKIQENNSVNSPNRENVLEFTSTASSKEPFNLVTSRHIFDHIRYDNDTSMRISTRNVQEVKYLNNPKNYFINNQRPNILETINASLSDKRSTVTKRMETFIYSDIINTQYPNNHQIQRKSDNKKITEQHEVTSLYSYIAHANLSKINRKSISSKQVQNNWDLQLKNSSNDNNIYQKLTNEKSKKQNDMKKNEIIFNRYPSLRNIQKSIITVKTDNTFKNYLSTSRIMPKSLMGTTRKNKIIKYNLYQPATEDHDVSLDSGLQLALELKGKNKKAFSNKKISLLKIYNHETTDYNKIFKLGIKGKDTTVIVKNKEITTQAPHKVKTTNRLKTTSNKIITTKSYTDSSTNMNPVTKKSFNFIFPNKKPDKTNLTQKVNNIVAMNTDDFFSQRRFYSKKISRDLPKSHHIPFVVHFPVTTKPRHVILRPVFRNYQNGNMDLNRNSLSVPQVRNNAERYKNDFQSRRSSKLTSWQDKIISLQKLFLTQLNPNVLEKPQQPLSEHNALKDVVISDGSEGKGLSKIRKYYLKYRSGAAAADKTKLDEPQQEISRRLQNNYNKTSIATSRSRRTIYFLSPTVPYNRYF